MQMVQEILQTAGQMVIALAGVAIVLVKLRVATCSGGNGYVI